jgi:hypothetical protein
MSESLESGEGTPSGRAVEGNGGLRLGRLRHGRVDEWLNSALPNR